MQAYSEIGHSAHYFGTLGIFWCQYFCPLLRWNCNKIFQHFVKFKILWRGFCYKQKLLNLDFCFQGQDWTSSLGFIIWLYYYNVYTHFACLTCGSELKTPSPACGNICFLKQNLSLLCSWSLSAREPEFMSVTSLKSWCLHQHLSAQKKPCTTCCAAGMRPHLFNTNSQQDREAHWSRAG